jgi:hypothetical protein
MPLPDHEGRAIRMTTIKARPTLYKGIQMRSRLEADYAASLDRSGWRWEYEPECFAGADGQWLPDFGCSYSNRGPLAVFTEVKPAGPLMEWIPGSIGFVEHADAILRRMAITWESRPDAYLCLVFWQYGGGAYLTLHSRRRGDAWYAEFGAQPMWLIWTGMDQFIRCRSEDFTPLARESA